MSETAIDYHDRRFRGVANTPNGQVTAATEFHYRQRGHVFWGTYLGGGIEFGTLLGTVGPRGELRFTYQHIDAGGAVRMGECTSTPEQLPDGRLLLRESWQWLNGDRTRGESIVEEIG